MRREAEAGDRFHGFPQEYVTVANELDMRMTHFVRGVVKTRNDWNKQCEIKDKLARVRGALDLVRRASSTKGDPFFRGLVETADTVMHKHGILMEAQIDGAIDNIIARLKKDELFEDSPWWPKAEELLLQ